MNCTIREHRLAIGKSRSARCNPAFLGNLEELILANTSSVYLIVERVVQAGGEAFCIWRPQFLT